MMKYAVVNTKGGVGKTTTAVHLATYLAAQDRAAPTTVCLRGKAILDEGRALSKNYAHTVIDAGGRDGAGLRNALLLADVAVIPVGASGFDAAAMSDMFDVISLAQDYNPDLQVKILLTRVDSRTKDGRQMREFLQDDGKADLMAARICERVAFRRSTSEGCTVEELGKDSQAVSEMADFYKELMQ